jgi:hypothetical protein
MLMQNGCRCVDETRVAVEDRISTVLTLYHLQSDPPKSSKLLAGIIAHMRHDRRGHGDLRYHRQSYAGQVPLRGLSFQ